MEKMSIYFLITFVNKNFIILCNIIHVHLRVKKKFSNNQISAECILLVFSPATYKLISVGGQGQAINLAVFFFFVFFFFLLLAMRLSGQDGKWQTTYKNNIFQSRPGGTNLYINITWHLFLEWETFHNSICNPPYTGHWSMVHQCTNNSICNPPYTGLWYSSVLTIQYVIHHTLDIGLGTVLNHSRICSAIICVLQKLIFKIYKKHFPRGQSPHGLS